MSRAIEEILQDRVTQGIVNVKYEHVLPTSTITLREAGHPVPDEAGVVGTQRIVQLLKSSTAISGFCPGVMDLKIFFCSGFIYVIL